MVKEYVLCSLGVFCSIRVEIFERKTLIQESTLWKYYGRFDLQTISTISGKRLSFSKYLEKRYQLSRFNLFSATQNL